MIAASATGVSIDGPEDLAQLPDGTLISWTRVGGDKTSRAVAFVHVEWEPVSHRDDSPVPVVWISPGGWSPMSPEDAGIIYPAQVVVIGDLDEFLSSTSPQPFLSTELITGGTWPREKALAAASRVWSGGGSGQQEEYVISAVLRAAGEFSLWLDGEIPAPSPRTNDPQKDAVSQYDLDHASLLRKAADTLREAHYAHGLVLSDAQMSRIDHLVNTLQARAEGRDK